MILSERQQIAEEMRAYWSILMPDVTAPPHSTFVFWCSAYSADIVQHGITRATAKTLQCRNKMMSTDDVARYASGVMRNEAIQLEKQAA